MIGLARLLESDRYSYADHYDLYILRVLLAPLHTRAHDHHIPHQRRWLKECKFGIDI